MMTTNNLNLIDFVFTNDNDLALVENGTILNNYFVSTRSGDDTVEASTDEYSLERFVSAIENYGLIQTGLGNDSIIGRYLNFEGYGIFNSENAVIKTGQGDDSILGRAGLRGTQAIRNQGTILMAAGNDLISNISDSSDIGTGIINEQTGIINTGADNDSIIADSGGYHQGSALYNHGLITTGLGDDYIETKQRRLGFKDPGFPISPSMINSGMIDMGPGNDTLTGAVIKNNGTINMGIGNDSLEGRFQGGGYIDMGPGNDFVNIKFWPLQDNSQIIDGGSKFDEVEFSFDDLDEYLQVYYDLDGFSFEDHVGFNITGNTVEVDLLPDPSHPNWTLRGFELFTFDGESYTFQELLDL